MSNSELKKLQSKWYRKLAKSGFKDIEDTNSPREMLKTWDSLYFLERYEPEAFKEKQRYYELAVQFLETHMFETSKQKDVWSMWANGASIRAIAKKKRVAPSTIHIIIKNLEGIMLGSNKAKTRTTK